ncbi:MAG TPA: SUMF1/EgtB/PvdO family nonheme iron enzyme [Gemmataceae bacterium]|nr:SUMF1/EgtB/PvdO family nonheme iron enzyme [Gemmataceae bacterium]
MHPDSASEPTVTHSPGDPDWADWVSRVAESPDPLPLVRADQRARWRAGHAVRVEAYLAALPCLTDEDALILVVAEVGLRREVGESPAVADYQARFPRLAADLAVQFDLLSLFLPPPAGSALASLPGAPAGFELLDEIGRGGMGVVFRARDTALVRDVAVKLLQDRYSVASHAARRFVEEAKITGQLQHPGIPPVHEVGVLPDGRPFLVMKLIKGRTLAYLIAEGVANRGSLIAAFEQVCQAVAYAHNHGVVHRDLKPANVMVGAFGEVQVMDWGLAKFRSETRAESADASAASTFHDPRTGADEDLHTQAGSFLGTPAYMSPEQAIGAIDQVDERSDVFGLGGVLCAILTGAPPFVAATAESTRQLAAQKQVEPAFARLDACGAEPGLVALCKRCLAGDRAARFRNAGEVAAAVQAIRAEVEERARRAELETVRVEGERQKAEVRAEGERQKAEEQRKRRRVQLALAGVVALVAVGAGIGANVLQQQAAEKRRAEDDLAAEAKRQADLRQARADALADALTTAETVAVPRVVQDLTEYRDLTEARLRELAAQPVTTKPGMHARLALLPDEPNRAAELAAYLPTCKPEEVLTIRDALKPHARAVSPGLWTVLTGGKEEAGKRVRAACALAGLVPDDERWAAAAPAVSDLVVRENPLEAAVWFQALEPVRGALVPAFLKRYPEARGRLRGGKLDEVQLAAEVSGYDLTATALARYTTDRPAEAAELILMVDPRHAAQFVPSVRANNGSAVPVLKAELAKTGQATWTDEGHETLARRRAQAAAVLLTLGEAESVWPVFAFPKTGDPTARSYLLARLVDLGADPAGLMRRFEAEPDVSAKHALLVALGGFPVEVVPQAEREALAGRLLVLYREHPDPGLHGAIDWVLRQKWGKGKELAAIDADLAAVSRSQVVARGLADGGPLPVGPLVSASAVGVGKDWFVNGEGQTYAVVRGPVEFTLGSPTTEPGRIEAHEPPHRKRIPRTFAIGTKEVTVEQFLRFRPNRDSVGKRFSPGPDTPAVALTWYDAAAYCNWLSEREGIPADQWCYEPAKGGEFGEGMRMKAGHLKLTGYRLPTEAEWEFACRGGAVTSRYHGRGEDLLPRYAWFARNAEDRAWPVGQLRPNELGLFDMLGNALERVEDPGVKYVTGQADDIENSRFMSIDERSYRVLRGGSFLIQPIYMRSANRFVDRPGNRNNDDGFRIVRTLY